MTDHDPRSFQAQPEDITEWDWRITQIASTTMLLPWCEQIGSAEEERRCLIPGCVASATHRYLTDPKVSRTPTRLWLCMEHLATRGVFADYNEQTRAESWFVEGGPERIALIQPEGWWERVKTLAVDGYFGRDKVLAEEIDAARQALQRDISEDVVERDDEVISEDLPVATPLDSPVSEFGPAEEGFRVGMQDVVDLTSEFRGEVPRDAGGRYSLAKDDETSQRRAVLEEHGDAEEAVPAGMLTISLSATAKADGSLSVHELTISGLHLGNRQLEDIEIPEGIGSKAFSMAFDLPMVHLEDFTLQRSADQVTISGYGRAGER